MAMDERPAWQAMSRRPRIMLDTETIMDNPVSAYSASGVEVNEIDRPDIKDAIDMVFDRALEQNLDFAPLDRFVMNALPKVCDATPEDASELIVDARFFDKQPEKEVIERMRDAAVDRFAKSEYSVELADENGETIGRIATIKNVNEENLSEVVEGTLHAFGYEIDDEEHGILKRLDPWNFSTIDQSIQQYPPAVEEDTLEKDRAWQMSKLRQEIFKSTSIEAMMTDGNRLDAYGEYGLDDHKVGAISTFDHEANLPRHIGNGTVIGFDQPMINLKTVDAVEEGEGSAQRIQEVLENHGAHGTFTDIRVEGENADVADPWPVEDTTVDVNPWQNIEASTAMAAGPTID